MANLSRGLERLRQPEYTGDNRCVPCTAVNLAIAFGLAGAVAVVSQPLAPIVLVLSLAAIYFRGYLVPGTPTLTKQYFPDWLLAKFDKEPGPATLESDGTTDVFDAEATEPVDPERCFLEHEIVTPCAGGPDGEGADDLCLTDDARSALRAAIDAVRDGDRERQVAEFLESAPEAVTVTGTNGHAIARVDGRLAGRWESDAALVADLAGSRVLADSLPDWEERSLEERSQLATGLRAFVETCPSCDGPISIDAETVESCCRSHEVYAITCDDCETRVLEVQQ